MSDFHDISSHEMARELVTQQQELIVVLKQEILRLQEQLIAADVEKERNELELRTALRTIATLNEKVSNVSENNEALLQTVQVFQRGIHRNPIRRQHIMIFRDRGQLDTVKHIHTPDKLYGPVTQVALIIIEKKQLFG